MYFTLAISAASAAGCAELTRAALDTDPRLLPIPGPPSAARCPADPRLAVIRWGHADAPGGTASHGGTIWPSPAGASLHARTGPARTDPVYVATVPGAAVVSDRAAWAAAVTGRLGDPDPVTIAALLNLGYPLGGATPFGGVRALDAGTTLTALAGRLTERPEKPADGEQGGDVAAALIDAVAPLADAAVPVEVSLTGGQDSRLVAAALAAAKVPFLARTHGAPDHPDVVVAGRIAARLGVRHVVTAPRPPGSASVADVLARLRCAVLVGDGMLSAFENVGRPDPAFAADAIHAGGHGGELLRGGYATYSRNAARGAAQFRRLTTRRLRLLRPGAASAYLTSLSPWAARFARGPLRAMDEFYLVNRAGRWSAAARQAYLLRERLVQPFFDDRVVRAARGVPLADRVSGRLHHDLLAGLGPDLLDVPLAGKGPAAADWRRGYGDDIAFFLRDYVLDRGADLFDVVSRRAAEQALRPPQADREAVWALATVAAQVSGDWLNARSGLPKGGPRTTG